MAKYKAYITVYTYYNVEVDADSDDEAREKAYEMFESGELDTGWPNSDVDIETEEL